MHEMGCKIHDHGVNSPQGLVNGELSAMILQVLYCIKKTASPIWQQTHRHTFVEIIPGIPFTNMD